MKLRGADVVARALATAGTRHIFTLSGNHVMPLFDAALDAKLALVHVRHEAAAVHMADAWGRLTGQPGVALVTGGPGHANARCGLNYLAVIGNDATWNAEYQIQLRAYGAARAQGCELLPTRYGAVASAMGAHGEDVASMEALEAALARAARAGKPACVNVTIERLPAPRY